MLLVRWARGVFGGGELAGVLAATSVAFDLSVFEIFVPLSTGGCVILAENALELPRLAADVRLQEVRALGWAGLATVLALMLLVRPLNILAGTMGSDLTWREKVFLSWLAPRGIVAAAVSALFAQSLDEAGRPGGAELRALVFLVIAVTVVVQGLSGGPVASWLGLRRRSDHGFVLLGANPIARAVGKALGDAGEEVVLIDSNPDACRAAENEGFRVLHGSGLDPGIHLKAALDTRAGCLGVTSNEEVNLLFARRARKDFNLNLHEISQAWQYGSVVRSWLLDLTAAAQNATPWSALREVDWVCRGRP